MNLRDKIGNRATQARRAAQQGFTLVEMAIVLVIIGLIIGGILKGQEIVNNARVKSQVAQIDSIKAAISTFVDKYGYYPGDDSQAATQLGVDASFVGNADGLISQTINSPDADNATEAVSKEPNMVWYELEAAQLLAGVQSSSQGTQLASFSYNLPGKIAASYLTYADFTMTVGAQTINNKMVRIAGAANPTTPTSIMREADAAQIDLKYDDGQPESGQIVVPEYGLATNCCLTAAGSTTAGACTASLTTIYGIPANGSAAGLGCALLWVTN